MDHWDTIFRAMFVHECEILGTLLLVLQAFRGLQHLSNCLRYFFSFGGIEIATAIGTPPLRFGWYIFAKIVFCLLVT